MQNRASSQKKNIRSNIPKHWVESGSETDASGSTETLTVEEQHAIWHMQRQEPQGQEQNYAAKSTVISVGGPDLGQATSLARNNDSNLSFGSSTNTLIIHNSVPDESWSNRWLAGYPSHNNSQNSGSNLHNSYIDPSKNAFTSSLYLRSNSNQLQDTSVDTHSRNSKLNISSTDLKEIPTSYLDRSEILKHLVANDQNKYRDVSRPLGPNVSKEAVSSVMSDKSASNSASGLNILAGDSGILMPKTSPQYQNAPPLMNRMPPPYYSHFQQDKYDHQEGDFYNSRRSVDKNTSTLSKSQPDLSNIGISKELTPTKDHRLHPLYAEDDSNNSLKELIDILSSENHTLKMEIDYFHRKITKLQKFEVEMVKVEEQHEALVKMGERREQLERLARHKLHCEVRRLTELNSDLREHLKDPSYADVKSQVDLQSNSLFEDSSEMASLRKELGRKDTIISQLVSQNRELTTTKVEADKDILNKDKKMKEQQKQIDILDSALTSTQTTVLKLEDEIKKNENALDQTEQLRKLLLSMQRASTRVDQSEKSMKQKLEDEIIMLRSQNKVDNTTNEIFDMRADMRGKDEKILLLESEISKIKQKFMLETLKNQIDKDSTGNLKEFFLDTSQQEKERRISQTRLDLVRSSDEYKTMSQRMEELELFNRSLEAVIAEREAKIKALLNRKSEEKYAMVQLSKSNAALNISGREDKNVQLRREHSVGPSSGIRSIPRKDEELDEIKKLFSLLSNLSLVTEDYNEMTLVEAPTERLPIPTIATESSINLEKFCSNPENKVLLMNILESKENKDFVSPSNCVTSVPSISGEIASAQKPFAEMCDVNVITVTEKENAAEICVTDKAITVTAADNSKLLKEKEDGNNEIRDKQPGYLDQVKAKLTGNLRIAPPPYHGHHQIMKNDDNEAVTGNTCNHKKNASNSFCRYCQNARRNARQPPLVRRANSSACHQNRRSVPSPSSSLDSLEDAPSIMERLKKEWELGMLSGPSKESTVDGSKTLPYPLATIMNLSQHEDSDKGPLVSNAQNELKQFSDEMSNLIDSKKGCEDQTPTEKEQCDQKVELIIREDSDIK